MMFSMIAAFTMIMIVIFIYVGGSEDQFSFDPNDERSNNLIMTILVSSVMIAMLVILW